MEAITTARPFNLCEPKGQKIGMLKIIMRNPVFVPTRRPAADKKTRVEVEYNNLKIIFQALNILGDRELDVFTTVINSYDSNREQWKYQNIEYNYIDIPIRTLIKAIRHTEPDKNRAKADAVAVLDKVMSLSMKVEIDGKWKGYMNLFSAAVESDDGETVRIGTHHQFIADCLSKQEKNEHLDFGSKRERKNFILDLFPELTDPVAKNLAYKLQSHARKAGNSTIYPQMLPYEKTMDGMGLIDRKTRRKRAIEKFKLIDKCTNIPLYKLVKMTIGTKRETAWVNTKHDKMKQYLGD